MHVALQNLLWNMQSSGNWKWNWMLYSQVMVVPYASAMAGCGDNHLRVEDANHFEVCKPPDRNHISYTKLVSLCAQAMAKSKHPEDLIVPVGVSLMRLQMNFCTWQTHIQFRILPHSLYMNLFRKDNWPLGLVEVLVTDDWWHIWESVYKLLSLIYLPG